MFLQWSPVLYAGTSLIINFEHTTCALFIVQADEKTYNPTNALSTLQAHSSLLEVTNCTVFTIYVKFHAYVEISYL